jgi:hypothetical protein
MWVCPCISNGVCPRFNADCACEYDNYFDCFGFKVMLHLNAIKFFFLGLKLKIKLFYISICELS